MNSKGRRYNTVLAAPVQIIAADDDGARHFRGDDHALEDAAADRHVAREGALLVDVRALERELGRLEAKADVADVPQALLALLRERALAAEEDGVLLLVRLLRLIGFPMRLRHLVSAAPRSPTATAFDLRLGRVNVRLSRHGAFLCPLGDGVSGRGTRLLPLGAAAAALVAAVASGVRVWPLVAQRWRVGG